MRSIELKSLYSIKQIVVEAEKFHPPGHHRSAQNPVASTGYTHS